MGLQNLSWALGHSLPLLASELSNMFGIHLSSTILPSCFVRWTQTFLSDRHACMDFQNHNSYSLRVHRDVSQENVISLVFLTFHQRSSCFFFPSILAAVEAT